jgi:hypothetical protein
MVFLAIICAGYAVYVYPFAIVYLTVKYELTDSVVESLMNYMHMIAIGPIGLFIWSAISPREDDTDV